MSGAPSPVIERLARLSPYTLSIFVVVAAGVALLALGRVPICACGTIKLWHGVVNSSENSQHIFDWYTATHVLHGFLFYAGLWWLKPHWPLGRRFLAAVVLEAVWEVLENSPIIIDRYRTATISLDYYGDSVINSLADIGAMAVGFALAARLPLWATITLGLVSEAVMAFVIRDNLALNIIMLINPLDSIKLWQQGL